MLKAPYTAIVSRAEHEVYLNIDENKK